MPAPVHQSNFISTNINITGRQPEEAHRSNLSIVKGSISLWTERWFLSSNAKDIGTLYLIFALFSGLLGTAFSVLIRLELSGPGVQFIADNQLYNSIITAHAILMIFFLVKLFTCMLKDNVYLLVLVRKYSTINNNIEISSANNGNYNNDDHKSKGL